MDKVNLSVEYWNYKAAEAMDVDGTGPLTATSDDRGTEINVKLNHEMSKNINCEVAYVIRDAGEVNTTPYSGGATGFGTLTADETSTFGYFMINVKFM